MIDGLAIWEIKDRKILHIDYGLVEDPVSLLQAVSELQTTVLTDPVGYSLVDFAHRSFPTSFVEKYKVLAATMSDRKIIVSAYLGLLPELYEAAKEVMSKIKSKTYIEFFDSEAAAIEWLLSFEEHPTAEEKEKE